MIPIGWKLALAVVFATSIGVECVVDALADVLFDIELALLVP